MYLLKVKKKLYYNINNILLVLKKKKKIVKLNLSIKLVTLKCAIYTRIIFTAYNVRVTQNS